MTALRIGSTLRNGKYEIVRVLGTGSFGITYQATTKTSISGPLGQMEVSVNVAIKEFFMKDMNDREEDGSTVEGTSNSLIKNYRQRFRKEAENLSKLHHAGIVKVIEIFEENNTTYYVMEFIEGESLDDYISKLGHLPEDEALRSMSVIGDALAYMHKNRMLHLDMKPKNIMRSYKGNLILIDFGLSKQYTDNGEPESSTTIGLGTKGYAPTEQVNYTPDGTLPVTIDVYALGGTLYKMLTGQTPPEASIVLNQGLPVSLFKQFGIREVTVAIVEKAMCPIIRGRYQSVEELLAAIKHLQSLEPADLLTHDEDTIISQDLPEKEVQESLLDAEPVPVNSSEVKKKTEIIEESKQKPNVQLNKKSASNHYKNQPKRPAPKFWKYGIVALVLLIIGVGISFWFAWKTPSSVSTVVSEQTDTPIQSTTDPAVIETQLQIALEAISSTSANTQGSSVQTFSVTGNGKTVSFTMKKVEAGSFQMGSNSGYDNEKPVHQVTISKDYYMGETEVTQALWYAVMGQSPTSESSKLKWTSTYGKGDDYPAYYISYEDCQEFIQKLNEKTGKNFRMPTEAEWEYAARGGNKSRGFMYAGSNDIKDVAWYDKNSYEKGSNTPDYGTHPVGKKQSNELGLYDMSGNVFEWCYDWYDDKYYTTASQNDPKGPSSGTFRVHRGGCWYISAEYCRPVDRYGDSPNSRIFYLGLRLAL